MGLWHEFYDAMAATVHDYGNDVESLNEILLTHNAKSVLDIGCGTGTHACLLAQKGYVCEGLDIDETMIAKARNKALVAKLDVHFQIADGRDLHTDRKYDAVLCQNLPFPHADLPRVLRSTHNILQPKGVLVMGVLIGNPEEGSEYIDFDHVRIEENEYVRVNLFRVNGRAYLWHQVYFRQGATGFSFDLRTTTLPFFASSEVISALVAQHGFTVLEVKMSGRTDLHELSGADIVAMKN